MTVTELLNILAPLDGAAIVTVGTGPGVVKRVTPTASGFVILDGVPDSSAVRGALGLTATQLAHKTATSDLPKPGTAQTPGSAPAAG